MKTGNAVTILSVALMVCAATGGVVYMHAMDIANSPKAECNLNNIHIGSAVIINGMTNYISDMEYWDSLGKGHIEFSQPSKW